MIPQESIKGVRQGVHAPDRQVINQDFLFPEQAP
jgi:hypothetical protein